MRPLPLAALLLFAPLAAEAREESPRVAILDERNRPATVLRNVDGDTLHLEVNGQVVKVRLLGIDCPESRAVSKCGKWKEGLSCKDEIKLGKRAGARTKDLAPQRSSVTFEAHGTDRYGRTLAYVTLPDGRDIGLTLLKEGVCKDWSDRYPHPRAAEYKSAAKR